MSFLSPDALKERAFPVALELLGGRDPQLTTMPGGASLRRYHRIDLTAARAPSLVVMETGDPQHSDEVVKGGATELPFLNVQRYLVKGGVPVPEVYRYDQANGLVYLEDLGDITFESRVAQASEDVRRQYYRLAIDQLVAMQRYAAGNVDPSCLAFGRRFDYDLLKWELDHFREYGLEAQGLTPSPAEREELERIFRDIAGRLAALAPGFVHRDYQSRNLMVQDVSAGPRLRVIDFQDALLGTVAYDLVGLLRDSYVVLPPPLLAELVGYYATRAEKNEAEFRELFALQTVQRKLKDAGRFVFIEQVKKIPGFMQHIPSSLAYVNHALGQLPQYADLKAILARHFAAFRT
jgi:aminoglycoside/choline kinase family phosphotransferase